jgi:hypothetical protein
LGVLPARCTEIRTTPEFEAALLTLQAAETCAEPVRVQVTRTAS